MSASVISPIQLDKLYLVDSSFHIENDPAPNMNLHFDVRCDTLSESLDGADGQMEIELIVECHLSDAEDESIVKMTASATVYAAASSPLPEETNREKRREYMLSNLIALAYAHAKSHIMSVTALSPMNALILPAILPSEMAKASEQQ